MPELRGTRVWWTVALTACALALPAGAADGPGVGQPLPGFTGKDVLGQQHSSQEYMGKPTLLVAITDKNAGDEMRQWFDAADQHAPASVQRESIISLHLPFFVGMGTVRRRVQAQVPRQFWDDTLVDRDGTLAGTLGLGSSQEPYVIALDARGQVLAVVNGKADSPQASRIWSSLNTNPAPLEKKK
ncbi:TlpA family protein disulfide reductase [Archangium violaceum]|uniref:TlpA family protein disulfide reductase n=1 Tax=Archangium violaceum TaxID=83451 RepID=UPI0036DB6275